MADAPPTPDPITRVHRRLWEILEGYAPWAALAKARVRFDGPGGFEQVFQEDLNANKTPLVMLTQGTYDGDPYSFDAASVRLVPSYDLIVVANDLNTLLINQLVWHTARALHLAGPYLGLPGLVVNPAKFRGGRFMGAGVNVAVKKGTDRQAWQGTITVGIEIRHADVVSGNYPCATTSVDYGTP